jgi:hypothetical protein
MYTKLGWPLTILGPFRHGLLQVFNLLAFLAVARLQPALGRVVFVLALVLGHCGKILGKT